MPKSQSENAQGNSGKKNKSKKKSTLIMVLIVLAVLAGSSAGSYFFFFNRNAGAATEANARAKEMENLDMGDLVVNLTGNSGTHYLRVRIVLEYPKEKKLAAELNKKKYQLSDVLITNLRGKTLAEVISAGSVEELKKGLVAEINSRLEHGKITGIYFTDFLVQ